jgi:hypothetical protein
LRQHVLEGLGWRIHRIWSTDWWLNPEGEVKKILERLQALMEIEESASNEPLELDVTVKAKAEPAPAVAEEIPSDVSTLPIFTPVVLDIRTPDEFYELRIGGLLAEQMMQVIEGEGPISESVLFRKVARAWGLERTGSRIVERLKALITASASKTYEGSNTFYWPKSVSHSSLAYFRVAGETPASKRHIDEVCLEEVSALVLQVLQQAGGTPRQDLARSVCRLVGMSSATAPAIARVALSIQGLSDTRKIAEVDGNFRLVR